MNFRCSLKPGLTMTVLVGIAFVSASFAANDAQAQQIALKELHRDAYSKVSTHDSPEASSALTDGKLWSAWVSANEESPWWEIHFPVARYVHRVELFSGNAYNRKTWKATRRVKKLKIVYAGGEQVVELKDAFDLRSLTFAQPIVSDRLRFEVLETYGDGPFALSEVKLYEPADLFSLKPQLRKKIENAVANLQDPARRENSILIIEAIGDPSLAVLVPQLGQSAVVRTATARVMARSRNRRSADALADAVLNTLKGEPGSKEDILFLKSALDYFVGAKSKHAPKIALRIHRSPQWAPKLPQEVLKALAASRSNEALPVLVDHLKNAPPNLAELALPGFAVNGKQGLLELAKLAELDQEETRVRTARALGWFKGNATRPIVLMLVDDTVPEVRAEVIKSLGRNHHPRWEKRIIYALGDLDPKVQRAAVDALAHYKTPASAEALVSMTRRSSGTLQMACILALEKHDLGALEHLLAMLLDPSKKSRGVVELLENALSNIAQEHPHKVLDELRDKQKNAPPTIAQKIAHLIAQCGEEGAAYLFRTMEGDKINLAFYASRALQKTPAYARKFILENASVEALQAREHTVITRYLSVAGATQDPALLPLFRNALKDKRTHVRSEAARNLIQINHPEAHHILLKALYDKSSDVREAATTSLGTHKVRAAVPRLVQLIEARDKSMIRAIWALGEIGDKSALDALHPLLKHHRAAVRQHSCIAIGRIGHEGSRAMLLPLTRDKDEIVRFQAQRALHRME